MTIEEPYPRTDAFRVSIAFAAYAQRLSRLVATAGVVAQAGR